MISMEKGESVSASSKSCSASSSNSSTCSNKLNNNIIENTTHTNKSNTSNKTSTAINLLNRIKSTKLKSNNNNSNTNSHYHHQPHHTLFSSTLHSAMMPSVTSRLKKNIARTKEKILQGMGKTDRTNDENFDFYVSNFEQQNAQAGKLAKELNKYLNSLRETQKSSKAFYDTLKETYEANWPNSDNFSEQINLMELKWIDYINRLANDVQSPLVAYLNEFPELKKKIEKRENRLLDYDEARHTLESVQTKSLKKSSPNGTSNGSNSLTSNNNPNLNQNVTSTDQLTKITKLKIDLEDKQHIYEEINQTLCMALPVLFDNRVKFYSSLFQTFFHTETMFHSDSAEAKSKLDVICENLSMETFEQTHNSLTMNINSISHSDSNTKEIDENENSCNGNYIENGEKPVHLTDLFPSTENSYTNNNDTNASSNNKVVLDQESNTVSTTTPPSTINGSDNLAKENCNPVLYRVKATYAYDGKELDELTFGKDDIIEVVDGTESEKEELDDGWRIGVHLFTNKRGLFPENFTKRI